MAKTREEMQDIALGHMDKINRRNKTVTETPQEEYERQVRESKWTPQQRMQNKSKYDWQKDLEEHIAKLGFGGNGVGRGLLSWCQNKFKTEFEGFHKNGNSYEEVVRFVKDKEIAYLNR